MKYKGKFKYKEYINGLKNEEYICICEVEESLDELQVQTKNSKKDNMYLRVLKNNDIIYLIKKGHFNYQLVHKEGETQEIQIEINSNGIKTKISNKVKTRLVKYMSIKNMHKILIEFEMNSDIIKCVYEIEYKLKEQSGR